MKKKASNKINKNRENSFKKSLSPVDIDLIESEKLDFVKYLRVFRKIVL